MAIFSNLHESADKILVGVRPVRPRVQADICNFPFAQVEKKVELRRHLPHLYVGRMGAGRKLGVDHTELAPNLCDARLRCWRHVETFRRNQAVELVQQLTHSDDATIAQAMTLCKIQGELGQMSSCRPLCF